jgi:putative oxidoreductase
VTDQLRTGTTLLRVAAASVFIIHGLTRTYLGGVHQFGDFLEAWHIPFGFPVALLLTIVEVAGGALLAAGYLVRGLAVWFVAQIAAGIVMVHAKAGWFVVGAGRDGMEYSVLIIACLAAVALTHPASYRLPAWRSAERE